MSDAAKKGKLTELNTASGTSALSGGFFIYRDLTTVSTKAAHFARAAIQPYANNENAPPLIFHIAVANDKASFRAPNFLAVMTKTSDSASGEETWNTSASFDSHNGLYGGVPANLAVVNIASDTYNAATFVGVKNEDGSGASALEVIGPDGTLTLADIGAIKTRMEDAGSTYLAAIAMASPRGGPLYLENSAERKIILFGSGDPAEYVSRAALDGDALAFAWSVSGQGWHIAMQTKDDVSTRGELVFARTGDPKYFTGFPTITSGDVNDIENGRNIADLAFADGKLFALLYGFEAGKHYYQALAFDGGYSGGKFKPVLQGLTNTIYFSGDEIDRRARFQKITKNDSGLYTAIFSCAGGLRQFQIAPSAAVPTATISSIFSSSNIMDLDIDDEGQNFAFIKNKTIGIRSLSKPDDDTLFANFSLPNPEGTTSSRLSNSSLVLTSKRLFISAPEGSSAPFWVIDVSNPPATTVSSKCATCHFNGLALFNAFPNQLLVSSDSSGVEYYDISSL